MNNKDFLELTNDQKKHWIYAMVDTLSFVAGYKSKQQGQCVANWYYRDMKDRNGLILAYMKKYPDKTPSMLLIALTEKDCKKFVTGSWVQTPNPQ